MKKVIIVLCAFVSLALFGCDIPPALPTQTQPHAVSTPVVTLAQKPTGPPKLTQTPIPQEIEISAEIAQTPILKNGKTLDNLSSFFNMTEDELLEKYTEKIELVREPIEPYYRDYRYSELGINIISFDGMVSYIDLNKKSLSFNGITHESDFYEVKEMLGETETFVFEDGLPGLYTYELRYVYKDIKVRIYSFSKNGEDGIYINIADDYMAEYRTTRITTDQISRYFDFTKEELITEIGTGDEDYFNDTYSITYNRYGVIFVFDSKGENLKKMHFSDKYQINDLKAGANMNEVIRTLGKSKVKKHIDHENGDFYETTYKYKNFLLHIYYFTLPWETVVNAISE